MTCICYTLQYPCTALELSLPVHGTIVHAIAFTAAICFRMRERVNLKHGSVPMSENTGRKSYQYDILDQVPSCVSDEVAEVIVM